VTWSDPNTLWLLGRASALSGAFLGLPFSPEDSASVSPFLEETFLRMSVTASQLFLSARHDLYQFTKSDFPVPTLLARDLMAEIHAATGNDAAAFWSDQTKQSITILDRQNPVAGGATFAANQSGVADMVADATALYWVTDTGNVASLGVGAAMQAP